MLAGDSGNIAKMKESRNILGQTDKYKESMNGPKMALVQIGSSGDPDKRMHPGYRDIIYISALSSKKASVKHSLRILIVFLLFHMRE